MAKKRRLFMVTLDPEKVTKVTAEDIRGQIWELLPNLKKSQIKVTEIKFQYQDIVK